MPGRFHGSLKGSGDSADGVMLLGAGTVEAQTEALDAMLLQFRDGVIGQFGRGTRRYRDFKSNSIGIFNQFKDIFAAQGIAAREDQVWQWISEADELIDKSLALLSGEL